MKGLLIKDYKLMLGQKSFLGIAALMSVLYLVIYKDPTFAVVVMMNMKMEWLICLHFQSVETHMY